MATSVGRQLAWIMVVWSMGAGWANAQTVYSCRADGHTIYQDTPCGGAQRVLVLRAVAPSAPPPGVQAELDYAEQRSGSARSSRRRSGQGSGRTKAPTPSAGATAVSYRCIADNGATFYRHTPCPAQVEVDGARKPARGGGRGKSARGASRADRATYAVRQEAVARTTACREILRAGALTRTGREHDEVTDPYEKNLGRDPCA